MKELEKSDNQYRVEYKEGVFTIYADNVVTVTSVFWDAQESNLLLAVNLYFPDGRYQVDYIRMDESMQIKDVFTETEGVMPSFLFAPDYTVWVRLSSTNTDKIRESVLPFRNRSRIQKEKLLTEFAEDYSILFQQEILFFSKDLFDKKKQDKIGQYIFDKNNLFKNRKVHMLPLPSRSKVISGDDKLQMIHIQYPKILHREMQLEGKIEQEREYLLGMEYDHVHPVRLSFTRDSILFVARGNELYEITINQIGRVINQNLLLTLEEAKERFYNIWEPILFEDAYLVRFNFQDGNGYIVIKQGKAMEGWIQDNGGTAYKEVLSSRVIELKSTSLLLTNIQKISDDKCALIYSKVNRDALDESFQISILNIAAEF